MEERWENMSEEKIILRAQRQDSEAIDYLMKKYKSVVRRKARTLFIIGGDQDDLMQEGMIGLFKAIRDYNKEKDTAFSTFAELCISRQIYSAIKSSNRLKNLPLNSYISIYAPAYLEENGKKGDFMVDMSMVAMGQNPEEIFIDRETTDNAKEKLFGCLSKMEKEVMDYYLQGMTYQEIAQKMEKEAKAIDNALQRIKNKVNKAINKEIL